MSHSIMTNVVADGDYIRRFDLFVFQMYAFTRHDSGNEQEEQEQEENDECRSSMIM